MRCNHPAGGRRETSFAFAASEFQIPGFKVSKTLSPKAWKDDNLAEAQKVNETHAQETSRSRGYHRRFCRRGPSHRPRIWTPWRVCRIDFTKSGTARSCKKRDRGEWRPRPGAPVGCRRCRRGRKCRTKGGI